MSKSGAGLQRARVFMGRMGVRRDKQGDKKSGSQFLLSVQSNNNLWISVTDWYAWENGSGGAADWRTNLDYDGFDWGDYVYAFKWGDRYPDLPSFSSATGLQPHGIHVDKDTCFETFDVPDEPPASVPPQFMTLNPGCNAVDAGVVLANVNEDFGWSAPDLGAYELDAPLPHYGPRPAAAPPAVTLYAAPASQAMRLTWAVDGALPPTSTWQIDYQSQTGTLAPTISGLISPTRAYTLTDLSNYVWYTITLNAMLDGEPWLTDTARAMPSDIFVYLPLALKD